MNIGFELECYGTPFHTYRAMYGQTICIGRHNFNVAYDGSIYGIEVKSPILTHNDLDVVPRLIQHLKTKSYRGDKTCGLHVHVEVRPELRKLSLVREFWKTRQEEVLKRWPIWKSRKQWCGKGNVIRNKYSAINIHPVYPTLEFRLFNSVLNTRHICRAIKESMTIVNELNDYYT